MVRVSIYVKNKQYKPSNYYRIVQYVDYLKDANITIHSLIPNFLYRSATKFRNLFLIRKLIVLCIILMSGFTLFFSLIYDILFPPKVIIIQKSLSSKIKLPCFIHFLLKYLINKSYFIWDFDDNILYDKEITKQEFELYCNYSNTIIVPSLFLKKQLPETCFKKTMLLPTTDAHYYLKNNSELTEINKKRKQLFKKQIHLIWVATSSNLCYLERIVPILDETAKDILHIYHKKLVLKIVCDQSLSLPTNYLSIIHIPWSRKIAFYEQKQSHIGLMPLIDTEYTRGKAGFKLIQYLATGLPIIASGVGYNKNHFSKEVGFIIEDSILLNEWKTSILSLISNELHWETYSYQSYAFYLKNFNPLHNVKKLRNLLDFN